jgi:hypothetical protein
MLDASRRASGSGMKLFPAALAITALVCSLAAASGVRAARAAVNVEQQSRESQDAARKIKDRFIQWNPPNLDKPLRAVSASPPCNVADVLKQAAARVEELAGNVPNFTADERIQYEARDDFGSLMDADSGTFEYLALFVPEGSGWAVKETRTPLKGTHVFPASAQDIGLPELAFIFLPRYQGDFEMTCEGAAPWNGQAAWVMHFQQRPDKPAEMVSIAGTKYRLKLKGRAWLAADSGEVLHLETGMLEPISAMGMRNWWLSINYGPVQFPRQNAQMWLPQTVDAYAEFDNVRTMIYHTFADFMMFSVHTHQGVGRPAEPH